MYAILHGTRLLPHRFPSWDEAVEFAQEDLALAPDDSWEIVCAHSDGNYYRLSGRHNPPLAPNWTVGRVN